MPRTRSATILIELTVAIGIMAVLATMGISGLVTSIRHSAIDASGQRIAEACQVSRELARTPSITSGLGSAARNCTLRYGVVLVDPGDGVKPWVAVTYGSSATVANVLLNGSGKPVYRRDLASTAGLFTGADVASLTRLSSTTGIVGWCYQYDTGWLCQDATTTTKPAAIGVSDAELTAASMTPANTVRGPALVTLGTTDGRRQIVAIRCLPLGTCQLTPWRAP